jgi:hypothetical protein
MSRYEGLWEKADYVGSMLTPRIAERKSFSRPVVSCFENLCASSVLKGGTE